MDDKTRDKLLRMGLHQLGHEAMKRLIRHIDSGGELLLTGTICHPVTGKGWPQLEALPVREREKVRVRYRQGYCGVNPLFNTWYSLGAKKLVVNPVIGNSYYSSALNRSTPLDIRRIAAELVPGEQKTWRESKRFWCAEAPPYSFSQPQHAGIANGGKRATSTPLGWLGATQPIRGTLRISTPDTSSTSRPSPETQNTIHNKQMSPGKESPTIRLARIAYPTVQSWRVTGRTPRQQAYEIHPMPSNPTRAFFNPNLLDDLARVEARIVSAGLAIEAAYGGHLRKQLRKHNEWPLESQFGDRSRTVAVRVLKPERIVATAVRTMKPERIVAALITLLDEIPQLEEELLRPTSNQ